MTASLPAPDGPEMTTTSGVRSSEGTGCSSLVVTSLQSAVAAAGLLAFALRQALLGAPRDLPHLVRRVGAEA